MEPAKVASVWVFKGLSDLYFGFDTDEAVFTNYALYFEIMGLEKFLKAVHLLKSGTEYSSLSDQEARKKIDDIAKTLGHDIKKMIKTVSSEIGSADVDRIKASDFDGYSGRDLVRVVAAGYNETRYPNPAPISSSFPIKGTQLHWDPLSGSGITKFIYALCNLAYRHLAKSIDFSNVLADLNREFGERESFRRFNNVFWERETSVSL